jgi:hypothetical protein
MESMLANYQSGCLRRKPDVKIRPVPEWSCCIAFTPDMPNVYMLNTLAWLIVELCDSKTFESVEAQFISLLSPQIQALEAKKQLIEGLRALIDKHIIEHVP